MAASLSISSLHATNWQRLHSVIMAEEDPKSALDVPQVSISSTEASNMPSTQLSQGHDTPQRDVVMADVSMDQAVRPFICFCCFYSIPLID